MSVIALRVYDPRAGPKEALGTREQVGLLRRLRIFFFQAEDGIRDDLVTGVQTCALPISLEALSLFLGIWLLFLLLAIYYLSQSPDGRVSRLRESVSEHLSAESRAKALLREKIGRASCRERV